MEIDSKRSSETSKVSGEKIASDGDLSTEILLRLPISSVLRSKCVSKLWYSLVTNPRFPVLRNSIPNPNPNSPSGLFLERPTSLTRQEYDFVPFDVDNHVKPPFKRLSFDRDASSTGISLLHSVNGLMLCHSHCVDVHEHNLVYDSKYYVYNPTVNQFTTLPKLDGCDSRSISGMSVVFNPLKSTHFRVVCVRSVESSDSGREDDDDYYRIDVYSSETGKWRACSEPFPYLLDTEFMGGVYWNEALHWLNKEAFVSYFKLDEECIHQIPSPDIRSNYERICNRLVESGDSVLVIDVVGPHSSRFNIFEMKKDYSGWLLKYKVDLLEVTKAFPEMYSQGYIFAVHCLVLGEKEDDSFFVVEIPGKAIRYNLKSKTFHKLCDFALPPTRREVSIGDGVLMFGRWGFGRWPGAFLFTESLAPIVCE